MAKRLVPLLLLLAASATLPAQDYSFQLMRNASIVRIDSAGGAEVGYQLAFRCNPGARAIDVVDIGLPNGSYDLASARAGVGGVQLSDIRVSEYVKPFGVEVHLDPQFIQPGDSGTLDFSIHLSQILFADARDTAYASFEFSPTWYGSDYVTGSTRLECSFVFPPGTGRDEPRYHREKYTDAWYDFSLRAPLYRWVIDPARPDKQFTFGASFPARHVPAASVTPLPTFAERLFRAIGRIISVLFKIVINTWIFWLVGGIIVVNAWHSRLRRMKYLPPQLSIEGVGVKRGLAAPEAALLLEAPLDRVVTMILFGLVKKRAVEVASQQPKPVIKVLDAGKAQYPYEQDFIKAVAADGGVDQAKLKDMVVAMIKSVNDKLKGFSRKETVEYYRSIAAQAWDQVKAAGTPELKCQALEENYDWMIMDRDYGHRMRQSYGDGLFSYPTWWGPMGYGHREHHLPAEAAPSGSGPAPGLPKLPGAEFANRVVTATEGFAAGIVGGVDKFTGGVTAVTNPVPVSSSSGGSHSGGSSCACACACAGCACACAGGGR